MQAGEGPIEGGPPLKAAVKSWASAQAQSSPELQAKWTCVDRSLIVCPPVISKGKCKTTPAQSNIIECDDADGHFCVRYSFRLNVMLIYEDAQAVCPRAAASTRVYL